MKVAFINTLYAPNEIGGAERAVRVLAEALVAQGDEAVVISLSPTGKFSKSSIAGVTVYYVGLANVHWHQGEGAPRPAWRRALWHLIDAYNPIMGARVRQILAAEKPDVVETNNLQGFSVAVWRAARRLHIPVVQVLHDYYLGCSNSTMFKRGKNCGSQCVVCALYCTPRRSLSHIPRVVSSVSARTLERLQNFHVFSRVALKTIVPTAIQVNSLPRARPNKPPGSRLVLGYFGRIEQTKGIELLLRAVLAMPQEVTLLIGGKGASGYLENLQRQFSDPHIEFLGFVQPDVFFGRIDALVVPSIWEEPLGRVIFEGFARGVPAIVANIGGMPEIVEHDVTGYVFEPNDADGLVSLLKRVVFEGWPAERFRSACYTKSLDFSIDTVLGKHFSCWHNALAQGGETVQADLLV